MSDASGISAMTSVAASRVWRSASCSTPAFRAAVAAAAFLGRTIAAALRTPAAGCFSAATAARYASEFGASISPRPLQRPQRVHRAAVDPDGVDGRVLHERDELRDDVFLAALDEQPLRRQAPEHVVGRERVEEPRRVLHRQGALRRRRRVLVGDPVEASAPVIAQRRLVGVARAVAEARRRRVVLDDEVVPVREPHGAVGADLRVHGREPLLGARREVPSVARHEPGALFLQDALPDHVRRRFVDEGDPVPGTPSGTAAPCRAGGRRPRCTR